MKSGVSESQIARNLTLFLAKDDNTSLRLNMRSVGFARETIFREASLVEDDDVTGVIEMTWMPPCFNASLMDQLNPDMARASSSAP